MHQYWVEELGGGDPVKEVSPMQMLFVTLLRNINIDGFDIDYEPGYGHSGTIANGRK